MPSIRVTSVGPAVSQPGPPLQSSSCKGPSQMGRARGREHFEQGVVRVSLGAGAGRGECEQRKAQAVFPVTEHGPW